MTLIQRFGSAANLNIHLHCLVLDGVYRCDADGEPRFDAADAPTEDELAALLQTLIGRLMRLLVRRGVLERGAPARDAQGHRRRLCVDIDGFSLHAAVRVKAHECHRLEKLCRYITRPAVSDERIELDESGQVRLPLKTPWRDGTTHLVMSPLQFMQRLVPRLWLHLIRFHGVLAPNAKWRARIVLQAPANNRQPDQAW